MYYHTFLNTTNWWNMGFRPQFFTTQNCVPTRWGLPAAYKWSCFTSRVRRVWNHPGLPHGIHGIYNKAIFLGQLYNSMEINWKETPHLLVIPNSSGPSVFDPRPLEVQTSKLPTSGPTIFIEVYGTQIYTRWREFTTCSFRPSVVIFCIIRPSMFGVFPWKLVEHCMVKCKVNIDTIHGFYGGPNSTRCMGKLRTIHVATKFQAKFIQIHRNIPGPVSE